MENVFNAVNLPENNLTHINIPAVLRREFMRETNRTQQAHPLRPMLRAIGKDIEQDMCLLRDGRVEEVIKHMAYYAIRLAEC